MQNFLFALPTRIAFGAGAIDETGSQAADCGRRALVITGKTFARRSGLIERLTSSLANQGIESTIFDEVEPNPPVETIDRGGELARDSGADFVLGLGGGSALDAAKAIALASVADRPIWEYTHHAEHTPLPVESALPIVQVPIVASTGSETNGTTFVYEPTSEMKAPISSPHLQAKAAIIDPTLTFTVPPHYTAVGGMNIVSQLLESYLTSDTFAVSDRITEGLIHVVMDSLPRAMRRGEDLDARSNLSWTAALASSVGTAGRSPARPLMALAHPLSARYGVEHGVAVAGLWPSFMRYALANRVRLPQIGRFKRYALLGRQIFGVHETDDEVAAEMTSYRFANWLRSLGMPTDLRDFGLNPNDFPCLAERALAVSGDHRHLMAGLGIQDIEHIYEGSLRSI